MIARKNNTFDSGRVKFSGYSREFGGDGCEIRIDNRPLFRSRVPYFRALWARRGQWVSLPILMMAVGEMNQKTAMDTLRRLVIELPRGFELERKKETVFPDEPNPALQTFHWYYRLTTPETLPAPAKTGEATLPETEWDEVPLEVADHG